LDRLEDGFKRTTQEASVIGWGFAVFEIAQKVHGKVHQVKILICFLLFS
jgi:hypothetical protein